MSADDDKASLPKAPPVEDELSKMSIASGGATAEGATVSAEAGATEGESAVDKIALQRRLFLGAQKKKAGSNHKFWDTQPVPKMVKNEEGEEEQVVGPLEVKTVEEVRATPYALPKGFEWCVLEVTKEEVLLEAYTLLAENYVEDDDNMFRFDYSPDFLRWALMPPDYFPEWHVGLRSAKGKLLAMITGIPARTHVLGEVVKMAEINFLCVHKSLREKRLAPVLIKEVTRRVNLRGQWQAVYTAGVKIPTPIGVARYWHRSLNPKKLISVGFSRLGDRMTMARTIKLFKVPEQPQLANIRAMEKKDVPGVEKLLRSYLEKFKVWIDFDEHDIAHWLLPRKDVIYSYVIESNGVITDLCSFYNLPSTIIGNPTYNHLKAAYSFYNVATTVSFTDLMKDALIFAHKNEFDVFNALDIMQNSEMLKELKFGIGDGQLHYYLYNYFIPEIAPSEIGIVLL